MLRVSVRQFRLVCVAALVALLLSQLPALGLLSLSKGDTTLRLYKFYGALVPPWVIRGYAGFVFALVIIGLIGMLNFWRFSRWCLAAALAVVLALRPFLGLVVYSPYEAFFASLFSYLVLWLMIVSFWTPIAERFAGKAEGGRVP